ncbi:putative 2OG-Fe(II) oxygenase [Sulfurirhabdus autotrophica]|uniref:Putative 2-oxoglutarate-Fe(II)-dependent oxygenase superfamily protein n=1 Tax=Sulfurirhabdus autotrophica TaxID=1706046 RepID=A0A4R3YC78_9PROT|nr:putative 2OG-Fe(II) oxygenase [Sulfurirhabdus autotrophica]TCV89677.1 putative 2-oxoglutarate-Fe(II)-dependent oxygenase superfamily protein [Sulfurirhabdus autotrophica]
MESLVTPTLYTNSTIHVAFLPEAVSINQQIKEAYQNLGEQDLLRRSHFFNGRYENLYLDRGLIPAIGRVMEQAEMLAQNILQVKHVLRSGFWMNDMGPGHVTTEHDHDDDDELLSGVYYVHVPENAGELVVLDKQMHTRTLVTPQAGMFVFFAPTVLHSVTANLSEERRLSMGMNFGPMA